MTRRPALERGFTVMELMIAVSLLATVFLGATAIYVSATKSFKGLDAKSEEIGGFLALEHMSRRIGLGNQAVLVGGGAQIKIRWDYADYNAPLGAPPNGTPVNFADDTYIKYGVVAGALRFRIDAAQAGNVTAADPEVEPGLRVTSATPFALVNNRRVAIALAAQIGNPARTKTLRTQVSLGGRAL